MSEKVTRGTGLLEGFLARQRAQTADSLIPKESRSGSILDIGCGNYPYFLMNTYFQEKHGLDRISNQAEIEMNNTSIRLIDFDMNRYSPLPYEDEKFDAVTMLAVLEHLETNKAGEILREAFRVMKFGGIFVATTPCWWTDKLLKMLALFGIVSKEEIDEHKNLFSQNSLSNLIQQAGFCKDSIQTGCFELGMNLWLTAKK